MAFSAEEAMALFSTGSDATTTSDNTAHFSRRQERDEGKNEKSEDNEEFDKEDTEPDVYLRKVPLDKYTTFLSMCTNLQFDAAIKLSKEILSIDPHDRVMQQYIPVLEGHLRLQAEEEEEEEEEDEDEDDNEEDDEEDEDEDDEDEDEDERDGRPNTTTVVESKVNEREGKEAHKWCSWQQ